MSYGNETMLTMPVQPAYNNENSGWGFGGDGAWWIIILFLFCFNGGMWGNGFNGGGMNGGVGSEVQRGFDHSSVVTKLDGITQGICDSTYALNNTLMTGFHGVDSAICNLGYQTQNGFNTLGHQIADCCCTTQRAIDGVNYNLATQACDTRNVIQNATRDILENNNTNTRAILDFLTQDKIATLTSENQALKTQNYIAANQDAQTAELLRRLAPPVPIPSYSVPNPNCCYGNYNYGCGCA